MITLPISIDFTTANAEFGPIDLTGVDELHYRLVGTEGGALSTATLSARYGLTSDDRFGGPTTAMTLDGSVVTIDVSKYAYAWFVVGTAQSGYKGTLHCYARAVNIIDGGGA